MVVEDDPDLLALLVQTLGRDYNVITAPHGLAALEILAQILPPDLIISDVSMPHVSGLTLAARLKTGPCRRVPIIFLTARDAFADVVAGINAGARHYLTKPFSGADLRARVAKILGPAS